MATEQYSETCTISDGILSCKNLEKVSISDANDGRFSCMYHGFWYADILLYRLGRHPHCCWQRLFRRPMRWLPGRFLLFGYWQLPDIFTVVLTVVHLFLGFHEVASRNGWGNTVAVTVYSRFEWELDYESIHLHSLSIQDGRLLIKAVLSSDIKMARELLDKGVNASATSWVTRAL